MMLPFGWADRAMYAGDSPGLVDLEKLGVAGVAGTLPSTCGVPFSVGGLDEAADSVRLTSVMGGGLQRS